MKPSNAKLTAVSAAAVAVLLAAFCLSASTDADTALQDVALTQPANMPVLKIGGKESADVYLQSLDIQVEVTGNIASTRHTMVFKNRTDRILEGELTFPLPDGRSVTYYALDINGRMREAVPVEKATATQVFEEIEQRQVDPGLLERVEGNNFRTRVYPIPANGVRTVSIGYEEELALENERLYYRLPMACPDPLEKFSVKATVWKSEAEPLVPESDDELRFDRADENYVASFAREDYRPARALVFALPVFADIPRVMAQPAQGSYYFLASAAPNLKARGKRWSDELAIIWDVSLSGTQRDLKRETEALNTLFADKKNATAHLYFLNNTFRKIGEYKVADGNWNGLKTALGAAVFDGGTDFSKINLDDVTGDEILFFSDGLSTLSDADFLKGGKDSRPIHCVVSSSRADYSAMKLIAGRTRGKFVNMSELSAGKLKSELLNETPQFIGVEHGGAVSEVYPSIAAPVHGDFSVAGISDTNHTELTLLFGFGGEVEKRIKITVDAKGADGRHGNVYKIWAQKKIAELDLDYDKNRAEITELGRQFGIATRNTSLIVLETADDYARYDIEPPASEPELAEEYRRIQKTRKENLRDTERDMLHKAAAAAEDIRKWWNRWKSGAKPAKPKYPLPDNMEGRSGGTGFERLGRRTAGVLMAVMRTAAQALSVTLGIFNGCGPAPREFGAPDPSGYLDNPTQRTSRPESAPVDIKAVAIKKDSEYLSKLTGKTADDYRIYLKLRDDYASSPAFYFDMAEWFYALGDREAALRVLTSIADLDLENASLYRLLAYRFKEYGEYALEKFVCRKVAEWRPMEPQSFRDYALALADNGETQAALDSLYSLLAKPYSSNIGSRSLGIAEVVITEMNRLIAMDAKLDTSKIDARLIVDIPVDVRVVINWNMDNTDIDLHVKDPAGEECHYRHKTTRSGGRISYDNTSGYGPEQFLLKRALKGKYRVYVNYFGDRQFTAAGPSTVMAEVYTKYAGETERRKVICFQMSKAMKKGGKVEKVEVAEFEF